MAGARIGLISPSNLASNPRLVKEADALADAGYQVTVIAGGLMKGWRQMDKLILQNARWQYVPVGTDSQWSLALGKLRRRWSYYVMRSGIYTSLSLAIWAHSYLSVPLAQTALKFPADLYIAHNLAALPAAAWVAKHHHAKLGFDAEDFHTAELSLNKENADYVMTENRARAQIEEEFLSHCHYLTAASPLIAEAYKERYQVEIDTILNVFPRTFSLDKSDFQRWSQRQGTPSLYWFSQTIGADRGLESIVDALAHMRVKAKFVLRGFPMAGYPEALMARASKLGVADRLTFLPPASPVEMARLAGEHDLGLSLEMNQPVNRSICLTNKSFTYLLGGVPVVFSSTPAQIALAKDFGEAAMVIDLADVKGIAQQMDEYFADPERIKRARERAWQLGQEQYNWDIEQQKFLKLVSQVLSNKINQVA